jgi:PleD family two-component response regulator
MQGVHQGLFLDDTFGNHKGETMLRIVLATARQESIHSFAEGLASDPEVRLEQVSSGAKALGAARTDSPHLVIIDSALPDMEPLQVVQKLLMVNAMVNTAVVSPLSNREFHEASEGLGVLARLPLVPGNSDAVKLLRKLRQVLGLTN